MVNTTCGWLLPQAQRDKRFPTKGLKRPTSFGKDGTGRVLFVQSLSSGTLCVFPDDGWTARNSWGLEYQILPFRACRHGHCQMKTRLISSECDQKNPPIRPFLSFPSTNEKAIFLFCSQSNRENLHPLSRKATSRDFFKDRDSYQGREVAGHVTPLLLCV
jgi:hypothetical protein